MSSRILILGDAMIDIYEFGTSTRLSPEAPVPIVHVTKTTQSLGGAANVAAHIASAEIKNIFAYKASSSRPIKQMDFEAFCSTKGIKTEPLTMNKSFPMTEKHRILSNNQQICRKDSEDLSKPDEQTELSWINQIKRIIKEERVNVVIFSDYDKGTLTDNLIQQIADYCHDNGIWTILDPKRPSFYKIKNLSIMKPNKKELVATNLTPEEVSVEIESTYLVYTLGKYGVSVYQNGFFLFSYPTEAKEVIDVCGAGDSVCSVLGIALYNKMNIEQAVKAANKAASYTITHLGCYCLSKDEINECLEYARR